MNRTQMGRFFVTDVPKMAQRMSNSTVNDVPKVIKNVSETIATDVPKVVRKSRFTVYDVPKEGIQDVPSLVQRMSNSTVNDVPDVIKNVSETIATDVPKVVRKSRFTVYDVPKEGIHDIPEGSIIQKIQDGRFSFSPVEGSPPLSSRVSKKHRVTYTHPRHPRISVTKGPQQKRRASEPKLSDMDNAVSHKQIPLSKEENKKIKDVIAKTHNVPPGYEIVLIKNTGKNKRLTLKAVGLGKKNYLPQRVTTNKEVVMVKSGLPPMRKTIKKGGSFSRRRRRRTRRNR